MNLEIVPAKSKHLIALSERLRSREAKELIALGDLRRVLMRELAQSIVAYAGLVDGAPGAVWGARAQGILSQTGYIWLYGSDLVERHPITFLRHSREQIAILRESFPRLEGHVFDDFSCGVAWLRWLGFVVHEPQGGIRYFGDA